MYTIDSGSNNRWTYEQLRNAYFQPKLHLVTLDFVPTDRVIGVQGWLLDLDDPSRRRPAYVPPPAWEMLEGVNGQDPPRVVTLLIQSKANPAKLVGGILDLTKWQGVFDDWPPDKGAKQLALSRPRRPPRS